MPKSHDLKCLISVPHDDGNFLASLKSATDSDLQDAAAMTLGKKGDGGRYKAISAEMNRRAKALDAKLAKPLSQPGQAAPAPVGEELEVMPKEPGHALKAWVKKPDAKAFAKAWMAIEGRRGALLVEMVKLGLVAEVIKASLPHGEFQPWVAKSLGKIVAAEALHDAARTIRRYMRLARAYWEENEKWEQPKITNEALARLKEGDLDEGIRAFIGGRTLREMLEDLRQAGVKANIEEAAEELEKNLATAEAEAKEEGKKSPVPTKEEAARIQLEIRWDEAAETLHRSLSCTKEVVDSLPVPRLEEAKRVAEEQLHLITVRLAALKREEAEKVVAARVEMHRRPRIALPFNSTPTAD